MGRRVFGEERGRKRRFSGVVVVRAKDAIWRWRFAAVVVEELPVQLLCVKLGTMWSWLFVMYMCGGIESDLGPLDLDQTVDKGCGIYGMGGSRIASTDWKFLTNSANTTTSTLLPPCHRGYADG